MGNKNEWRGLVGVTLFVCGCENKKKKKKFNSVEKQHMVCAEWADSCFMHS